MNSEDNNSRLFFFRLCLSLLVLFLLLSFFLHKVFSGAWLIPQNFELLGIKIRYYGLVMAVAVFSAILFLRSTSAKFGLTKEVVDRFAFPVVFTGFLGARLYHVFSSFSYYADHPIEVFYVWHGGLSIYGALIGGFLAVLYLIKKQKSLKISLPPFFSVLDWLSLGVLLGQILGRFGNLFNFEAYGYPTNLPWKMYVPESYRPLGFMDSQYFHPFFLYESLANIVIFAFLLKISKKQKQPGVLFWWYILLYNAVRLNLELIRIDSTFLANGLRLNFLVSSILFVLALSVLIFLKKVVQVGKYGHK